ncbi:MerR family transcriptional regulator [Streptomyces sp. NPDC035033]|uniref:MerR family transcriptional regulator n=1 Tax=Streptomyces sp. NPDC035033 TaxID=3155368 RepID=UPI0033CF192D
MRQETITIGELAARTGLSPKALRLYGERGLLPPARVDPRTSVRHYGPGQVERARRIALLRAAGLPLERIAAVLDADGADGPVRLLDAYWHEQRALHAARRDAVAYARAVLAGRDPEPYRIAEREVPERTVLCLQRHVDAAALPGFLAEATTLLLARLREADACLSGPLFAVHHGLVGDDSDGPVEVCAPTDGPVGPAPGIGTRIEPAHREAYIALPSRARGYPAMAAAHHALGTWLARHGHVRTASHREVYHPNWPGSAPDEHVADVAVPFRRSTSP